jgi:hypothetical protein
VEDSDGLGLEESGGNCSASDRICILKLMVLDYFVDIDHSLNQVLILPSTSSYVTIVCLYVLFTLNLCLYTSTCF